MKKSETRKQTAKHGEKKQVVTLLKGILIGATMLVPGVSGGSMAIILGIYDQLISSVSSFIKHKMESFLFLVIFTAGGFLGIFLFSRPILYLIQCFPMPMLYFFLGAVAGGVPLILRQAGIRRFSFSGLVFVLMGMLLVSVFAVVPVDPAQSRLEAGIPGSLMLAAAGFAAAVALVLPGISVSYLLLLVGLYDETMEAISQFYLPFLLPLGSGLLLGILVTARLLEKAMTRHPKTTYLMILGFVLGSMVQVFPGIPSGWQLLSCIVFLFAGFGIVMWISGREGATF